METKKIVLWVVIGVLVIAVLYVGFNGASGNVASNAQSIGQAAGGYGGMVGGC